MFAILPAWGLFNAAAMLVGQNLGAQQPDRAARSVWLTGTYTMAFLAAVAIVFVAAAEPLVAIFNDDPAVLAVGTQALRVISYGYIFYARGMVMMQAFNGAGDTMTPRGRTWSASGAVRSRSPGSSPAWRRLVRTASSGRWCCRRHCWRSS